MTIYTSHAGQIDLEGLEAFHNDAFGYTLYEEVVDPANPEGPRAIGMHVPAHSLSKAWALVESGYIESIELLEGSASLVVYRGQEKEWLTAPLTLDNPTADDLEIRCGDIFCIVTDEDEAFVLSRPSKPFDISFEEGLTKSPNDALSRFIVAHVAEVQQN